MLKILIRLLSYMIKKNWPDLICGKKFSFPSTPSIPAQLAIIIKNVDLRINFDDFSNEIKLNYPDVKNIIRLKNKFGNFTKLIKLELISPKARVDLLKNKKICIDHIRYDIDEYLAPMNVLICSKCLGIGHFRKQCPELKETCKTCGETLDNSQNHQCSNIIKCIHCAGDHLSTSMKCPVVKSFRDTLTKNILNNKSDYNSNFSSSSTSDHISNQTVKDGSFSHRLASWCIRDKSLDSKINTILAGLSQANETLGKLCDDNIKFQKFMIEKNSRDLEITYDIFLFWIQDFYFKRKRKAGKTNNKKRKTERDS